MIPKVIHYCWFGGNPKNDMIRRCIESWKTFCSDYEIIEWNEANYDVNAHPFMKAAYEHRKWAFVSDYARVDILNRYGGVYLDTDVELIASLDPFLDCDFFAGFESAQYVAFGLGFGAVAGHPVLRDIMNHYDTLDFPESGLDRDKISCPKIQTDALKKYGLVCNNQNQVFAGCHVYSSDYFCPMNYKTGKTVLTERTVSIHHYDMSWYSAAQQRIRKREWVLIGRFGPVWGKRLASVANFPSKLAGHARDGKLKEYIGILIRHSTGRRKNV